MRIDIKGTIISNDDKWIYDWFDMDSTCPKDVQATLDKANGQMVDVYINSGGGDIFAGSEIYTALNSYKGEVKTHVVGLAASAASVIAMAGKSDISPTAMIMVHNVSAYAGGDYRDMEHMSEVLKQANKSIAGAYMTKTGMSEKEALDMMDKETWLTAQQAVDKKLIDSVMFETTQLVASFNSNMLPRSVIDKVRNTVKKPLSAEDDGFFDRKVQAEAKMKLLNLGGAI